MNKVDPPVEVQMDLEGHPQTAFVVAGHVPDARPPVQRLPRMTDRELGGVPEPEQQLLGQVLLETLWCNRAAVQAALEALHEVLQGMEPDPVIEL